MTEIQNTSFDIETGNNTAQRIIQARDQVRRSIRASSRENAVIGGLIGAYVSNYNIGITALGTFLGYNLGIYRNVYDGLYNNDPQIRAIYDTAGNSTLPTNEITLQHTANSSINSNQLNRTNESGHNR